MSCTGVILAGGAARRFGGQPKGLASVDGVRIVDRVARALRLVTEDLLLVANAPNAAEWLPGVRTVADRRPSEGALAGIETALLETGTDILLVAWDMPFVSGALLGELRRTGETEGVDAVLPESDSSRRGVEPLCAWYAARCLDAVSAALDRGDRRVVGFHEAVRLHRLPVDRVAAFGDPARLFGNVNTPDDLAALTPRASDV
ncbi:MAG: molybdenum cofactor guanylyltransferase [Gemmatimonadota bacterium]|nr:molybdenum cofactor guanylyltransferase [Gemmatimonadota bacterium]